jgi:hypothetical protein
MIHVPDWKEGLEWYQKARAPVKLLRTCRCANSRSGVPTGWQPRRFYEPVTTRNSFYKRRANSQHDARRRLKSF